MAIIGATVMHKSERTLGIILGWDKQLNGFVRVSMWSKRRSEYIERSVHPNWLEVIANPEMFEDFHPEAVGFKESLSDIALGLALDTKDKEWFQYVNAFQSKAKREKEGGAV